MQPDLATERAQRAIESAEKLGNFWPLQALAVLQEEILLMALQKQSHELLLFVSETKQIQTL